MSKNKRLSFFDDDNTAPSKRSKTTVDEAYSVDPIRREHEPVHYQCGRGGISLSLGGPLSVCSVVGNYRTGKSYLLNRLLGGDESNNFAVSATTQSCTKGLWIMRKTLRNPGRRTCSHRGHRRAGVA